MYKNINIFLEDIETQTYVFPILFVNKYFKLVRNLNLNSRDKINNSIAIKFYHLKKCITLKIAEPDLKRKKT